MIKCCQTLGFLLPLEIQQDWTTEIQRCHDHLITFVKENINYQKTQGIEELRGQATELVTGYEDSFGGQSHRSVLHPHAIKISSQEPKYVSTMSDR